MIVNGKTWSWVSQWLWMRSRLLFQCLWMAGNFPTLAGYYLTLGGQR